MYKMRHEYTNSSNRLESNGLKTIYVGGDAGSGERLRDYGYGMERSLGAVEARTLSEAEAEFRRLAGAPASAGTMCEWSPAEIREMESAS
jgi:hypothetical protein